MTYPEVPAIFFVISQVAMPEPCQLREPIGNIFDMDVSISRKTERTACARHLPNSPGSNCTSAIGIAEGVILLRRDRSSAYVSTISIIVWAFGEERAAVLLQDQRKGLARNSNQFYDLCDTGRDNGEHSELIGTRRYRTAHANFMKSGTVPCDPGPLHIT